MPDMEKTIKELERFKTDFKPFCGNGSDWARVDDAISLLKEQQETISSLQGTIRKLSAALGQQPERKPGHWKYAMICSVCNEPLRINLDGRKPESEGIFCCPHCGARMDEEVNQDDRA